MTESAAKPKKPWWKHLIYLAIGMAAGLGFRGYDPDLTRLHPARPIVLELYTSLGCPECPPADRLLAELADELPGRVLPLSFHVTALDSANWRDPFAAQDFDRRQGLYHPLQNQSYTPQLVIEGTRSMQGAEKAYIKQQILAASKGLPNIPLKIERKAGQVCLTVDAAADPNAELRLAGYLPVASGAAPNGAEHALRNVVREWRPVPGWQQGQACLAADPALRYAAVLQEAGQGRVLGAAVQPLAK